jgi:hypothetical protein
VIRRRPRGTGIQLPVPKHPFRDTAIFNGSLAGVLLLVAWLTGGSLDRAVVWAAIYFVAATAWGWSSFRRRLEREAAAAQVPAGEEE